MSAIDDPSNRPQEDDNVDMDNDTASDEDQLEEEEENDDMAVDDAYATLTQHLDQETDRSAYDPSQDKEERRQLRQSYRKLITKTEENRRNYTHVGNNGLIDTLEKANVLYARVRNTQEATLDSKLLVLSADLGTQKARNLRLDNQVFNVDEFVSKIITYGRSAEVTERERSRSDQEPDLDWKKIGLKAVAFGKAAHSIDFMLGPLSVEKKQRKVTKQVRLVKNKEDLVQPTKLQESDLQQQENETSNNVNQIYRILDERGPVNYFEFITNPESFSQTAENMFYVSFLIRNAVAEIDDSSGQPILATRAPPLTEELADNLRKKQVIMNLDMALWKEIIETYGIRESTIPTRPKRKEMTPGKWY
ncbi:nuclear protein [Apophysomyces ossiformis]|uniref:Non-structural maintenance of chromosomes element 4 n=1 Tax=Apophysomyces ossiformis TaxID=679940 RepID=A0A8H7BS77_9FUNG|nr:nuclear protein [Apophysomyces ossiformis]